MLKESEGSSVPHIYSGSWADRGSVHLHCLVSEIGLNVKKEGMKDYMEVSYWLVLEVRVLYILYIRERHILCAQTSSHGYIPLPTQMEGECALVNTVWTISSKTKVEARVSDRKPGMCATYMELF